MCFGNLLAILYKNQNRKTSQSKYVMEIFSALLGEPDPRNNNCDTATNKSFRYSKYLPDNFLRSPDPSRRKHLYSSNGNYSGLPKELKEMIRGNEKKETFIAYFNINVPPPEDSEVFNNLRNELNVFDAVKRCVLFEAIYEYFLKFIYSANDAVKGSIDDIAKTLSENKEMSIDNSEMQLQQIEKEVETFKSDLVKIRNKVAMLEMSKVAKMEEMEEVAQNAAGVLSDLKNIRQLPLKKLSEVLERHSFINPIRPEIRGFVREVKSMIDEMKFYDSDAAYIKVACKEFMCYWESYGTHFTKINESTKDEKDKAVKIEALESFPHGMELKQGNYYLKVKRLNELYNKLLEILGMIVESIRKYREQEVFRNLNNK